MFQSRASVLVCVLAVVCSLVVAEDAKSDVIVLSDSDFEHLTQATTGATTGDWMVEFYAPWCGHCKSLAPKWEQLATDLKGKVNVAKVDCTVNKATAKRFGIRGYPSIYFLRQGKMYKYSGARTADAMSTFATGGYASQDGQAIAGQTTAFDNIKGDLTSAIKDAYSIVTKRSDAALFIFGIGVLIGVLLTITMFSISAMAGGRSKKESKAKTQ